MKVYVAGKVTGLEAIEVRTNFIRAEVEERLKEKAKKFVNWPIVGMEVKE